MLTENRYVNGQYLEKVQDWHEDEAEWKSNKILLMLERHQIYPKSVCDVGCGSGGILAELQKNYGFDVEFTGYDISPQAIEICKKKENRKLKFYNKDFLNTDSGPYDVLLFLDVLEHIPDYMDFLNKLKKRSVLFVFHVPLDISITTIIRKVHLTHMRQYYGHLHYFNKETALAVLVHCGFSIVDYFYTVDNYGVSDFFYSVKKAINDKKHKLARRILMKLALTTWLKFRKLSFWLNPDLSSSLFRGFNLLVLAKGRLE